MSEIIAKQIPAMLGAAAAQTARVRERVADQPRSLAYHAG